MKCFVVIVVTVVIVVSDFVVGEGGTGGRERKVGMSPDRLSFASRPLLETGAIGFHMHCITF